MSTLYVRRRLSKGSQAMQLAAPPRVRDDGRVAIDYEDDQGALVSEIHTREEWETIAAGVDRLWGATPEPDQPPPAPPPPSGNVYWGGRIGYPDIGDAPWNTTVIDRFEANADKKVSYIQFGQPFGSFDTAAMDKLRARGIIPHVEWMNKTSTGAQFTVTQIKDGAADAILTTAFQKAKAWQGGAPFILRWIWEPNGPWMDTYYGAFTSYAYSRPADYVAAFRRIHGIAQTVGAKNVTFMWNCNWWNQNSHDSPSGANNPEPWWPGNEYIDMYGVNGYADGTSFAQHMVLVYPYITAKLGGRPFYFETGCAEAGTGGWQPPSGTSKAQYIDGVFATLPNYPAINFFNWFNDGEAGRAYNSSIETSPSAQAAFKAGIANPRYLAQAPSFPAMTKITKAA